MTGIAKLAWNLRHRQKGTFSWEGQREKQSSPPMLLLRLGSARSVQNQNLYEPVIVELAKAASFNRKAAEQSAMVPSSEPLGWTWLATLVLQFTDSICCDSN